MISPADFLADVGAGSDAGTGLHVTLIFDLALQVVSAITATPGIELVGPLPPELGAHVDTEIAVSARSADPANAAAFIGYITRPEAAGVWKKFGLDR